MRRLFGTLGNDCDGVPRSGNGCAEGCCGRKFPGYRFAIPLEDAPVQALRLGHGLNAELTGQYALAMVILRHRRIDVAETEEVFHKCTVKSFPVWIADEGGATDLHRFGETV